MISGVNVFNKDEMERLHEASLTLLESKGVVFQTEEARDLFRNKGAKVEGKLVYIPRTMVEWALALSPASFELSAINPQRNVTVGDGMLIHPAGGEVFIEDLGASERRMATLKDFENLQKIYQACGNMDMCGYQPVSVSDIDRKKAGLYCVYETMLYTDKPWLAPMDLHDLQQKRACIKMYEIAMGEEFVKTHYVMWHLVSPESPLVYAQSACDGIIEFARKNQPIGISPAPMSGLTGPVSLYGNLLLANTETLAGICLAQLANEGIPVLPSGSLMYFNMKYATCECASPDAALMSAGFIQMYRQYYHLPVRAHSGITSSKSLDYQAGYEHMQSFLLHALCGVNVVSQSMGSLDNLMTVSLEKTLLDDELISRVRHIMKGIRTDKESLALDIIMEVPHGKDFMLHESTLAHYRESWEPCCSDWSPHDTWEEAGKVPIEQRAGKKVKEILAESEKPILEAGIINELKKYLETIN